MGWIEGLFHGRGPHQDGNGKSGFKAQYHWRLGRHFYGCFFRKRGKGRADGGVASWSKKNDAVESPFRRGGGIGESAGLQSAEAAWGHAFFHHFIKAHAEWLLLGLGGIEG